MLMFVTAVAWACIGEIDIVAVAEGKIISSSRIKDIQPIEKGVVKAIYVREGQQVEAGEALVELDQTLTAAEQKRITQELHFAQQNLQRERALLRALRGEVEQPVLSEKITGYGYVTSAVEQAMQTQLLQQEWLDYQSKIRTYESQKQERLAELQSNSAQVIQLQKTLPLITRRANALKGLSDKKLAPEMEYLVLEQERIEQQQTLAIHQAQQQQFLAAIETASQQIEMIKAEAKHQSLTQVDEYQRQVHSLIQELAKASDINAKQKLYAPVSGTVQQLSVHTIGGVVTEAQVLMQIVPKDDFLEVEAVLENKDIGFVFAGQPAEVKINTFNFTKYGVLDAKVVGVTADAVVDEVKGLVYKLRLKLDKNTMQVDSRTVDLLPGMTVMAEVKTGKRRLIEYVMSPLMRKMDESVSER
ncbi:HlyD family type I secretion periplasmic adaptor subunit [Aestuariirhabdus sp. Z084]|nr:HlyD family type I secretion periplasmic adaptor subunit [Aestuariirhabdus haliotis]MCL6421466.1 HlyD family type I secretion periplasmic adaptor subunit [Aestuariirhabdus haliotis]